MFVIKIKKSMKNIQNCIIISLLTVFSVYFKDAPAKTYFLDLDTAKRMALANNPDLVRSKMDLELAMSNYAESRARLYPSLKLDLTTPNFNESIAEEYIYEPVTQASSWQWVNTGDLRYTGSLNLEQSLPTGGNFTVSSILYKRNYYFSGQADNSTTEYSNAIRFSVQQPIFKPNQIKIDNRRSQLDFESAKLERHIRLREIDYIISSAYYSLVRADRRLNLGEEDFERWKASVATAEAKFKAGMIPEVEVLNLKVELARREGNLAATKGDYMSTADDLKLILGLELEDSLTVSADIKELQIDHGSFQKAVTARQELRKAQIDLENSKITYRQTKSNEGINASFSAYYDFDSRQQYFENLTGDYETNRGLSLTVSVPLYDWGEAREKIKARRISLNKSKYNLDQANKEYISELLKIERALSAAKSRLVSARLAESLAQKTYEITLSRFDSGAVKSTDLIDAQVSLNQAKNELLDSIIDYNITAVKYKIMLFPDSITG